MKIYEADCHLEATRLHLACGNREQARASLAQANVLLAVMNYHRRHAEAAQLERDLQPVTDAWGIRRACNGIA